MSDEKKVKELLAEIALLKSDAKLSDSIMADLEEKYDVLRLETKRLQRESGRVEKKGQKVIDNSAKIIQVNEALRRENAELKERLAYYHSRI